MGEFRIFKPLPFKQVKLPEKLFKVKLKEVGDYTDAEKPRLNFKFKILDSKYKGVIAGYTLWINNDEDGNPHCSQKGQDFLQKLSGKDDTDKLNPFSYIGSKFSALIKQEKSKPNKDGMVYTNNNIVELLPYETEEDEVVDDEEDEPKKKHTEDDEEDDEPKKRSKDEDDEDDEPKKKSKDDDDDEDDEPKKKHDSDDDDEDDEDDKPSKKDKDEDFDE